MKVFKTPCFSDALCGCMFHRMLLLRIAYTCAMGVAGQPTDLLCSESTYIVASTSSVSVLPFVVIPAAAVVKPSLIEGCKKGCGIVLRWIPFRDTSPPYVRSDSLS